MGHILHPDAKDVSVKEEGLKESLARGLSKATFTMRPKDCREYLLSDRGAFGTEKDHAQRPWVQPAHLLCPTALTARSRAMLLLEGLRAIITHWLIYLLPHGLQCLGYSKERVVRKGYLHTYSFSLGPAPLSACSFPLHTCPCPGVFSILGYPLQISGIHITASQGPLQGL